MLQKSSLSQTLEGSEDREYQIESCQAEVRANSLINQLFQEFEQDLDSLYPLAIAVSPTSVETTTAWLSSTAEETPSSDLWVPYTPYRRLPFGESTPGTAPESAQPPNSWLQSSSPNLFRDRLLVGVACASVLVTLGLWATSQWVRPPVVVGVPTAVINPADAEFAQYMERSLEIISQQSTLAQPAIASSALPALPTGAMPVSSSIGQNSNAVERVYIPVYQPQTPQPSMLSSLPGATSVAAISPVVKPLIPAAAQYTLRGVLELGERSVALVDMNGVTQRVAVGQSLGASGWQLMQVANQNAVVQKQGEVRSITVGQRF
jgi:hypothetical protein